MRILSATLAGSQLFAKREPRYTVTVYDVRSTITDPIPIRINDVVRANTVGGALPAIVGPRDFTEDVESARITEIAPDYVDSGVAAARLELEIVDPEGLLDPLESPAPAQGRWLRQGNVVVVREGDAAVESTEWPITFTGRIVGQPGRSDGRTVERAAIQVIALGREADFLNQVKTTKAFPQNTSYLDMIIEIAQGDMGLSLDEIALPGIGLTLTRFLVTQGVMEAPLATIAKILFIDGFMPRFLGDGRLGASDGNTTQTPARVYTPGEDPIRAVDRPPSDLDGVTDVRVIGLDSVLSKVEQELQVLATASITTGFFSAPAKIPVFWSDDRTQQATNVEFRVITSIADGLFNFGDEAFTAFTLPDGGSVEGEIEVDGARGLNLAIGITALANYLASAAIPDSFVGVGSGSTIPVGRLIEAGWGHLLFGLLLKVGRGQYEIWGNPYEFIFPELPRVAQVSGVPGETRKELVIENHLLNTEQEVVDAALRVLRRERAKQNQRTILMVHDLVIEPNDIIQRGFEADARRYLVVQIDRTLRRGGEGGLATVQALEVTAGVRP